MTRIPDLPHVPHQWFVRPDGDDASKSIHGTSHTQRVWAHAMALADVLGCEAVEREALHYACLWHDIGRTNDWADYYHGAKSAGRVVGMGLHEGLDPVVVDLALFAVTHHSGDEGHAERGASWAVDQYATLRVFRILKDADALDRVRLGQYDLDPSYLRHPESHARIDEAWRLLELVP